ncbi:MAG: ABC transporter ATP-binding protein [Nitrospinae bacterium]|nr:ABC transporter ATP-binding protein [Nitrospinota bacterium]
MASAALTVDGLSKHYEGIRAVDGVNFSVGEGEMFGIVGPDGAGKTTLFRMLCGIIRPGGGSAAIFGKNIAEHQEAVKREIGYFSQKFTLYGDLTVDENMEFFAEIHEVFDYMERREELLEFTRLAPFRKRRADRLSGGMKQKLALACTLIHRPKVIFLDEPTTGVDPLSRTDFWRILSGLLKSGITIVMSTPYMDEAERCGRIALMNNGRLMAVDSPANVKKMLDGVVLEVHCADVRGAQRALKNDPGMMDVQAIGGRLNVVVASAAAGHAAVALALGKNGIAITGWREINPSLENVFISLVTRAA